MLKRQSLAAAVVVAGSLTVAGVASAAPPVNSSRLRQAVTVSGITEHQAALEAIAHANPVDGVPTRATSTPGHEKSVEYVAAKMKAAGFDVSLQPFTAAIFSEQAPAAFEQVAPSPTTYPRYDGTNGVWFTADFSGDGDGTAQAVAVDFTEPTATASASDSGCEASDFGVEHRGGVRGAGRAAVIRAETAGKVALLQRGTYASGSRSRTRRRPAPRRPSSSTRARSGPRTATAS